MKNHMKYFMIVQMIDSHMNTYYVMSLSMLEALKALEQAYDEKRVTLNIVEIDKDVFDYYNSI